MNTIFDEDGLTLKVEGLDEAVVRLKRRRKEKFGTGLSSRSQQLTHSACLHQEARIGIIVME